MEGPGWHIQEKQQIKHHSQGSCHLLEVVSTSRVQNGTCLEKFKRFLNFPLQAKYQSCKTTYSRQMNPFSAGKTCLCEQGKKGEYRYITPMLLWCFPLLQHPQLVSAGRTLCAQRNLGVRTKALSFKPWAVPCTDAVWISPLPSLSRLQYVPASKSPLSATMALGTGMPHFGEHFLGARGQGRKRNTILGARSETTTTWGG